MRRISFYRPKEKLRGIKRRLIALDKWADSFEGYFPSEYSSENYWNWKIPILDRMVNTPTTTKELQVHCANAMLRAASHIEKSRPEESKSAIVTVLLTYPDMFSSEICVFFDKEYYEGFFERSGEEQKLTKLSSGSLVQDLGLVLPKGFNEVGYHCVIKDEWEGKVSVYEEDWWSYRGGSRLTIAVERDLP